MFPFLSSEILRKYVPKNITATQIIPAMFALSQSIRYQLISIKGILIAESGDTSERSPCFTALIAVILVTAFIAEEITIIATKLKLN